MQLRALRRRQASRYDESLFPPSSVAREPQRPRPVIYGKKRMPIIANPNAKSQGSCLAPRLQHLRVHHVDRGTGRVGVDLLEDVGELKFVFVTGYVAEMR